MPKGVRSFLVLLIGLAVSGGFIYLIVRGVELREVGESFVHANPWLIVAAALAYLLSFVFRTYRWNTILQRLPEKSFWGMFRILIVGWGVNNVLPFRLGEVARASFLTAKRGLPFGYGISTIFVERVLDGLTLLALAALVFLVVPTTGPLGAIGVVALTVVGVALVGAYVAIRWKDRILRLRLPKMLLGLLGNVVQGLEVLTNLRGLAWTVALSFPVWLAEGLSFWLTARALGLDIPPSLILASLVIANLGILIPSAPGYVGTFDYFAMLPLLTLGIQREALVSFVVLLHATQYILTTAITGGVLISEGVFTRGLWRVFFQRKDVEVSDSAR